MDCNNFFVSCERLFRPDLHGKPVAVLSSNDGCVVARSQEVKDLGIPMGAPLFLVRDMVKKHHVTLFSSNFPLYRDISGRVMHALREEFSDVSPYSVDEAFFTISKNVTRDNIRDIRARLMKKTGIPVSFGVASTKTIAKIANSEAKRRSGVVWLTNEDAGALYATMSCGAVWGIGRQMTKKLDEFNIRTVDTFLARGLTFIRETFGVHGERLFLELSGIRAEGDRDKSQEHASIMSTRSFGRSVTDKAVLMSAIGYHVTHVGEKLRERGLLARQITLIAAPNRHGVYATREGSRTMVCEKPTHDTAVLLSYARQLLETLYDQEVDYKKAGCIVSNLIPESYVEESLFLPTKGVTGNSVYRVVDMLNARYGNGTVRPGVTLDTEGWVAKAALHSKRYTTEWAEIASVKAL